MDIEPLAELATYPGTHDKDRYARAVRKEARVAMQEADQEEQLVLHGVLRIINRKDSVAENQKRLAVALDTIASMTGVRWRRDVIIDVDGESITRKGSLFSNPATGNYLVERGIIFEFNPDECTCRTQPEAICFAAVHII